MQNIILTGFMGTGKSTVGQEVARQLDWPFVDMDTLIEARQEMPIRRIFETRGEAHFRRLESDLCRELAARRRYVIATGGGALVNPANLEAISTGNLVICLDCRPEVLWRRLSAGSARPLLDAADRRERILSLLKARQPAYARIPRHIDVSDRPATAIAAEIIALFGESYEHHPR